MLVISELNTSTKQARKSDELANPNASFDCRITRSLDLVHIRICSVHDVIMLTTGSDHPVLATFECRYIEELII